ncbi:MAG: hypothetical protein ABSG36_16980 [Acidimicrobiales bacterium]|jgi:hypothetical protein
MSKSPLELVAQARIAEYRERAVSNSRMHRRPSSSLWNRFGIRRAHHAQRRLAATDPS